MKPASYFQFFLGIMLLCPLRPIAASESDELRAKAKAVQQEAEQLAQSGKKEKAEVLAQEAKKLFETAERLEIQNRRKEDPKPGPNLDKEIRHRKDRLMDMLNKEKAMKEAKAPERELAEIRNLIQVTERELNEIAGKKDERKNIPSEFRGDAERLEIAARKVQLIRNAAQNLKMAEMHDLARDLMAKSEGMERELQEGKRQLAERIEQFQRKRETPRGDQNQDIRAELERLRNEVKELRKMLEKR